MADSCQCMTKPTKMLWSYYLQLIKINEKKLKKNKMYNAMDFRIVTDMGRHDHS